MVGVFWFLPGKYTKQTFNKTISNTMLKICLLNFILRNVNDFSLALITHLYKMISIFCLYKALDT